MLKIFLCVKNLKIYLKDLLTIWGLLQAIAQEELIDGALSVIYHTKSCIYLICHCQRYKQNFFFLVEISPVRIQGLTIKNLCCLVCFDQGREDRTLSMSLYFDGVHFYCFLLFN